MKANRAWAGVAVAVAWARTSSAFIGRLPQCRPSSLRLRPVLRRGRPLRADDFVHSRMFSTAGAQSAAKEKEKTWKINLLYDSECPLCMREVEFLRKRDIDSRIKFTDICDPLYKAADNGGVDFQTGMEVIHGVLPDGSIVKGVEVFRRVYDLIGLGYIYAATRWPVVGPLVDKAYDLWAVNRLRVTGRPELEVLLRQRQEKLREMKVECSDLCDTKL